MESSRKSNKIRDIVRLQQLLKKWKKVANINAKSTVSSSSSSSSCTDVATAAANNSTLSSSSRSIKFLKKTLSFSERESGSLGTSAVPKGYVAVCVGKEEKRFVIPTEYLSHQVFGILLREAEEEFGFQQQGVLKLPCEVDLFENLLKMMEDNKNTTSPKAFLLLGQDEFGSDCTTCPTVAAANSCSPDAGLSTTSHQHHHSQSQMCR